MPKFSFTKLVDIDRDKFFAISTDYERFTEILPAYFLELKIVDCLLYTSPSPRDRG